MFFSNTSSSGSTEVSEFILVGFPGIQSWQHWLSIPLALLFFIALMANITLLITFYTDPNLHEPMYYFLAMLALVDLGLCNSVTPKLLGILWFGAKTISSSACFTQIYFIHCLLGVESGVFLVMAYDRYVAICNPLRYLYIITNSFVVKAMAFILIRNTVLVLPLPFLAARLHYCSRNTIKYSFCANLAVVSLACEDFTISSAYQLTVAWSFLSGDLALIIISYCFIFRAVLKLQAEGAAMKALSTCSSHLTLILFFYTVLVVLVITHKNAHKIPSDIPNMANVLHLIVPPSLNPIVYGVRTKEIKHGIQKVFVKSRRLSSET
ncbi:olfactory receptor 56A4-like [Microcaecilia unicolor]|uniref:Olfactory receptor 56A4-like n=1 Tax=Microcaecilia unicolor TaxID=1415580 RepID=A0A6P7WQ21_9AMPH|nr:olfactory receptor 56A4-like [Microcaecilia unicolor]